MATDVIIHEFGHFVYWKLSYKECDEWNNIWEDYKVADSQTSTNQSIRYAFTNAQEGFAEAFAAVEGFKYTSVNMIDPLYFGCKKLLRNHRTCNFGENPDEVHVIADSNNTDAKSLVMDKVTVMRKFNELDNWIIEIYDFVNKANREELAELKRHLGAIEDILTNIDKHP